MTQRDWRDPDDSMILPPAASSQPEYFCGPMYGSPRHLWTPFTVTVTYINNGRHFESELVCQHCGRTRPLGPAIAEPS